MNELAEKMHGAMKQTAIQNGHVCMGTGEGGNFSTMDIKDITKSHVTGLILGLDPANERLCHKLNAVSHWLGANLESAQCYIIQIGVYLTGVKYAVIFNR